MKLFLAGGRRSWQGKMPKSVILYLARSSEHDVKDLLRSVTLLGRNFLRRFPYPVIVFVEKDFKDEWKELVIKKSRVNCRFETIQFEVPEFLADRKFPEFVLEPKFTMGYRHMCRFFSGAVYSEPSLKDFDWYWRLDTDSFILKPVKYDLFRFMQDKGLQYGYTFITHDSPVVTKGLWELTQKFMRQNNVNADGLNPFLDAESNWDLSIYYTNFEIASFDFWRSKEFQSYFDMIDRSGGIYEHRWGDTPIHLLAVSMFLPEAQKHCFTDIHYQHQGFIVDPNKNKWYRRFIRRVLLYEAPRFDPLSVLHYVRNLYGTRVKPPVRKMAALFKRRSNV